MRPRHILLALVLAAGFGPPSHAYVAAGDRVFVATIFNPQIGPADWVYFRGLTQSFDTSAFDYERRSSLAGIFDKRLTETIGIAFENGYNRFEDPTRWGFQNQEVTLRWMPINIPKQEFLLTFGVNREFGTGTERLGFGTGATAPVVYFGKGLGDIGWEFARPMAIKGNTAFRFADNSQRADQFLLGLTLEYSLPYLQSKVRSFNMPEWLERTTPQIEFAYSRDTRNGRADAVLMAPGFSYGGEGFELNFALAIPLTRDAGSGVGVGLQIAFSLDHFVPKLARPLF